MLTYNFIHIGLVVVAVRGGAVAQEVDLAAAVGIGRFLTFKRYIWADVHKHNFDFDVSLQLWFKRQEGEGQIQIKVEIEIRVSRSEVKI